MQIEGENMNALYIIEFFFMNKFERDINIKCLMLY